MKIKFPVQFLPSLLPSTSSKPWHGRRPPEETRAFTRLELLALLMALAFLAVIVIPVLANPRPRAERATCVNNLRLIGLGFQIWGNDHGEGPPFRTPFAQGGLRDAPAAYPIQSVYYQFAWISNELRTPKILACPSDPTARVASDWSLNPNGGLRSTYFQNKSVSYFLGLEIFPDFSQQILAGDRNMMTNGLANFCSSGLWVAASSINTPISPSIVWTAAIHDESGNLLLNDGRVEEVRSAGLRRALSNMQPDGSGSSGRVHFLYPR